MVPPGPAPASAVSAAGRRADRARGAPRAVRGKTGSGAALRGAVRLGGGAVGARDRARRLVDSPGDGGGRVLGGAGDAAGAGAGARPPARSARPGGALAPTR